MIKRNNSNDEQIHKCLLKHPVIYTETGAIIIPIKNYWGKKPSANEIKRTKPKV